MRLIVKYARFVVFHTPPIYRAIVSGWANHLAGPPKVHPISYTDRLIHTPAIQLYALYSLVLSTQHVDNCPQPCCHVITFYTSLWLYVYVLAGNVD
jgi:hypothetical protein